MSTPETLQDFYKRTALMPSAKLTPELGHFNVFRRQDVVQGKCGVDYNRRDFYKITLIMGQGRLNYAGRGIEVKKNALLFSHPSIPYSWEMLSKEQKGYFCLFTNNFLHSLPQTESLLNSPLYKIDAERVFVLEESQVSEVSQVYEQMIRELNSDYEFKYELIRDYIKLLVHMALRVKAVDNYYQHPDASSRISAMFIELLERQFPVSYDNVLKLRSAADYAFPLAVHTNHLNRAVKKVTGKTTSFHIAARIFDEARALLQNTNWNISDIAYCLGFETPAYFNRFFKK